MIEAKNPIVVEDRAIPYVAVQIHFERGSLFDPPGKEGLCYLTSQMLLRGTARHSRKQFVRELDTLGAAIDIGVGREAVTIEVESLERTLGDVFGLLGDASSRPAFAESELDKLRRQTIAENDERRDNDEALARHIFYQALLQPDRSARPIKGTRESLSRITHEDVLTCYRQVFTVANMGVGAAGAIGETELLSLLGSNLRLPAGPRTDLHRIESRDPERIRVILVDKPGRTQTQILFGHDGIAASDPRFFPLKIANTVFGGTFTARLSAEIREKRGWSYGAYSYLFCGRTGGSFMVRYHPAMEDAVDALALGLRMQHDLCDGGVTDEEVDFARQHLTGAFPFRLETPRMRMEELLRLGLLDLGREHLDEYVERVGSTTPAEVNDAIRKTLKKESLTVLMTCTAEPLRSRIEALPGVGEVLVHPYDEDWPHGS